MLKIVYKRFNASVRWIKLIILQSGRKPLGSMFPWMEGASSPLPPQSKLQASLMMRQECMRSKTCQKPAASTSSCVGLTSSSQTRKQTKTKILLCKN